MSNLINLSSELVEKVKHHLEANEYPDALELFHNDTYRQCLKDNSWDLIPILCNNVTKDTYKCNENLVTCCEDLLELLAKEANPEEAVLEFLEQLDEADDYKFPVILNLLKILLFRNISSRVNSLEWCLNSIRAHLEQFPVPDAGSWGTDEGTSSETIGLERIANVFDSVILFYTPFVSQVINEPRNSETEKIKILLSSKLIQTFDIVMPYVNYDTSPRIDEIQCKLIRLVLQLIPNPFSLLEHIFYRALNVMKKKTKAVPSNRDMNDDLSMVCDENPVVEVDSEAHSVYEDEMNISNLAYGMFFFTLLTEADTNVVIIPMIYNPKYILLSLIYVTTPFFEKNNDVAVRKGLLFLELLLNKLHEELTRCDLYFSSHKDMLIHLNNIMVYSQVKENREVALNCFQKYIWSFDWEGRYWLLFNFRSHVQHSGTLGYLVTLIKELVSKYLNLSTRSKNFRKYLKYFRGKLLFDLIKKYCFLPQGSNIDLVENADHVISSLNLIRFLILRDKRNVTDVKNFIKKIHGDFLKPLKDNVVISKKNWSIRKNGLDAVNPFMTNVDVSVEGQSLPKLMKGEEESLCNSSLNAIDLIDSLLTRVLECIQESYAYNL